MSPPLVIRVETRADFDEAFDWYVRQRAGLGVEFVTSVQETLDRVRHTPELFPCVFGDIRRALVHRYPYSVFYVAEPSRIVEVAIFHSKRDPGIWRTRGSYRSE